MKELSESIQKIIYDKNNLNCEILQQEGNLVKVANIGRGVVVMGTSAVYNIYIILSYNTSNKKICSTQK